MLNALSRKTHKKIFAGRDIDSSNRLWQRQYWRGPLVVCRPRAAPDPALQPGRRKTNFSFKYMELAKCPLKHFLETQVLKYL